MARLARRRGQRGMMSVVAAQMVIGLVVFLMVIIIIGQLSVQRDEQQNAVDAVNFAASIIAKNYGKDAVVPACNEDGTLHRLARENLGADFDLECDEPIEVERDGLNRLRFTTRVVSRFDNPYQYDDGHANTDPGVDELRGSAVSDVVQTELSELELPKVVFVLDYSGSMGRPYGAQTRIVVLREVVNAILDLQLPIEFGVTLFSDRIIGPTVAVAFDEQQDEIRDYIESSPGGDTNYELALRSGTQLLRQRGAEKGYLVFITDGEPNQGDTMAATHRAWAAGYTILPVFIGVPTNRDLLISMSGSQADPANPSYFFEANDPAALLQAMEDVFRTILCAMGPIDPAPADADDMGLLLKFRDGTEWPLIRVLNPRDLDEISVHYNPADQYLKLSEAACDEILYNDATVVARHGSPVLLQ